MSTLMPVNSIYSMVEENKDLQHMHTFGVPWSSTVFCSVDDVDDAQRVVAYSLQSETPVLVVGGGSNILPTKPFDGLVIKNEIAGRGVTDQDRESVLLSVGSGENWHDLVVWAVASGYYGLENLALIPGTVGGAVVQNIGAYDVDLQRYIETVEAINITNGETRTFSRDECEFEYRNSIFKKNQGMWMVTVVNLRLHTQFEPVLTYQPLREISADGELSATDVMNKVIEIRRSKLPDWNRVGTAGSFFGNPRISDEDVVRLHGLFSEMPVFDNYGTGENTVPAGWLIEQADIDPTQKEKFLYPKHHLIVVNNTKNTDATSGKDIYEFTRTIQTKVQDKFGIELVR